MGPTLETGRLILRPPIEEDLDGWSALMGNEASAQYIGGVMPRSAAWRAMATMTGSWSLRGFGMFSVLEKATGRWVGRVGPWQPEGWPGPEIGWALLESEWGQGFAEESARASIRWAFETLGWTHVIHIIAPENVRSQSLAARLGASKVGPTRMPAPYDGVEVDLWRQTGAEWSERNG